MLAGLALAVAVAFVAPAPAQSAAELRDILPAPGTYEARTMQPAAPAEYQRLAERVAAAIQRDPSWLPAFVKEHEAREGGLPYDPRFGVSEAEYARMLILTGKLTLQETGRARLTVEARPGAGVAISASPSGDLPGHLVIAAGGTHVETPLGLLDGRTAIDQEDPNSPLGKWRGSQWSNEAGGSLAAGRRED